MKSVSSYVWGNNAIKIVNKRGKIKIVDVKKEAIKKRKIKSYASIISVSLLLTAIFFISSFSIVSLHSQQVLLSKQVYQLNTDIIKLEAENKSLLNTKTNQTIIDYDSLYHKALKLGMTFPSPKKVYTYKSSKSSAVRIKNYNILNS